jgi:hypothetical protein
MHFPDGRPAPDDIPPEAKEMIQEIVPLRDRRKDFPDHAAMLSGCNLAHLSVFLHFLFFTATSPRYVFDR